MKDEVLGVGVISLVLIFIEVRRQDLLLVSSNMSGCLGLIVCELFVVSRKTICQICWLELTVCIIR